VKIKKGEGISLTPLKIAIACPRGVKTGGPEALHQLCHELNSFGVEAFLINTRDHESAVSEYEKYNAPWGTVEELPTATHLVVPETVLEIPKSWRDAFSGEIIVWWLSVDFSSLLEARDYELKKHPLPEEWNPNISPLETVKAFFTITLTHTIEFLGRLLPTKSSNVHKEAQIPPVQIALEDCNHIAQSVYAQTWVFERFRKQPHLVSDYIWRDGSKEHSAPIASANSKSTRKLIVAFNAGRGAKLVELVRKFFPAGVEFVALKGMSGEIVTETLSRADAYLDLGSFPGRDRTPREAALSNCPVLIPLRGSARHYGDFSIDDFYRMDLDINGPESVAHRLYEIASNKAIHTMRQAVFRATVDTAKQRFSHEVKVWLDYLKLTRKGVN
jgi:hypothetical protein